MFIFSTPKSCDAISELCIVYLIIKLRKNNVEMNFTADFQNLCLHVHKKRLYKPISYLLFWRSYCLGNLDFFSNF